MSTMFKIAASFLGLLGFALVFLPWAVPLLAQNDFLIDQGVDLQDLEESLDRTMDSWNRVRDSWQRLLGRR